MKIDHPGDLIYWTYYMIDWSKANESQSDRDCQQCGRRMGMVTMEDKKGETYDGYVCHSDKVLIWVRNRQQQGRP